MPLFPDPSGAFDEAEPEAVLFAMFSGDERIECRVEWSALRDRAVADGADPDNIASTFKKHRAMIEQIASDQFDAGKEMPVVRTEHLIPGSEPEWPRKRSL
ncbi:MULTISPECIES: DUF1488 family protein [unclassified Bradyrhizobium]|uniref:DUF1488 family protein n=1 Tax=unclassified Bradyrhizobium TaxID=2631580 RepID=UPI001FFB09D8|nr:MULTISPECIES: DUF1488 family protein [unclassified Bradyrhizobium]MCK1497852.1 DUF1488 family protein [Bradyrhizobium sp. 188]UPJ80719.1 DUF1488 family protein [Bradyrhizobium sp. 184]UPJ88512.1 DUF1488 family protein [Bradyrhizobium sp. 183]